MDRFAVYGWLCAALIVVAIAIGGIREGGSEYDVKYHVYNIQDATCVTTIYGDILDTECVRRTSVADEHAAALFDMMNGGG